LTAAPPARPGIGVAAGMAEIDKAAWDAVANPDASAGGAYNPFISYDFLDALESSGSATGRTGWTPRHLLLTDPSGRLTAAMPAYLKSHSMGEYVFDHGWAEALERAGGRYYPKLQASVPFTPATGPRLLVLPGSDADARRHALAAAAVDLARQSRASSVHATFLPEPEARLLGEQGWLLRTDQQFHFENPGYRDFSEFLAALASRKRKTLRRERQEALADGISIEHLTGTGITEAAWDAFFAFYMDTGNRKWGRPYLNRRFFSLIGERMADRILLIMARRDGRYIAGALNFIGSDTLFGRYWGAVEHHPFLHFEVCYYQAIDWALAHGLKRVEAGAQGEHKLARGYLPATTWSAHWIADPRFRAAVAAYLEREREMRELEKAELEEHAPYRHSDPDGTY